MDVSNIIRKTLLVLHVSCRPLGGGEREREQETMEMFKMCCQPVQAAH